mmetsp:Transcript_13419/g.21996  ORF Transcript_13419/g.21996 Transcript_13419/m.21996 type:complete len:907 (-) Transcript_13419:204-2924(-)
MSLSHGSESVKDILVSRQNLQYEDEISRNPYHLKAWLKYLDYQRNSSVTDRYVIYERALKFLPRSYKLWFSYLSLRRSRLENLPIDDQRYTILANSFERCLVHMHKMPVIWHMYLTLLTEMRVGTRARKTFDRALQALPITQHETVWDLYIAWSRGFGVEETTVRVYRRYLMYDPTHREELVSYLETMGQYEEAANQLAICVNDEHYVSPSGCTRHQMWMRLCDMCATHPEDVSRSLKVDPIIRSGIARFSDEVGKLWTRLVDYYIRLGQFEKARDVYEEAIHSVITVRDFTVVFDSYVKFEETVLTAKMAEAEESDSEDEDDDEDALKQTALNKKSLEEEVELRMSRLEYLMDQRPILLNSVVLRQNPHNVYEWHKRVKLYKGDDTRTLMTFMEAVKTVDPKVAHGRFSSLWLSLAWFYESHDDLENARIVLKKATEVEYRSVEELCAIWCAWAEMEMKHEHYEEALAVMQQAVTEPLSSIKRRKARAVAVGKAGVSGKSSNEDNAEASSVISERVHRSVKVWSLYLDLEESLGTVESCRAAYDKVMELKVITPQMVLNYSMFLEENNFFEDSFRVFERAVVLFDYPHVKTLWLTYIDKFIARYEGSKLERLRDLFEQAVCNVPAEFAAEFYLKYAKAEEEYGLARHAMAIYDRATRAVPEESRADMYRLYIRKVEQYYGITKTRPVYERAITELNDDMSREMCIQYAAVESKIGEVDRARAVFQHGSQFADPRKHNDYWRKWKEFEEAHGNEDTFRDMLRVQRSVEAANSQVNYMAQEMMFAAAKANAQSSGEVEVGAGMDGIALLAEREALDNAAAQDSQKRKFVASSENEPAAKVVKVAAPDNNPDEIDIEDDEDDDKSEDVVSVKTKPVPSAVFGSLDREQAPVGSSDTAKNKLGALDRFS